jgi:hypothetical protein
MFIIAAAIAIGLKTSRSAGRQLVYRIVVIAKIFFMSWKQNPKVKEGIDSLVCIGIGTAVVVIPLSIAIHNYNNPSTAPIVAKTDPSSSNSTPTAVDPEKLKAKQEACRLLVADRFDRAAHDQILSDRDERKLAIAEAKVCN